MLKGRSVRRVRKVERRRFKARVNGRIFQVRILSPGKISFKSMDKKDTLADIKSKQYHI